MNYKRIHDIIINRGKLRKVKEKYMETHHIIPKCLGGNNEKTNKVYLTYKEHVIIHVLLTKIYKNHPLLWKLEYSVARTCSKSKCLKNIIRNKKYINLATKKRDMSGSNNPFFNKTHNEETKLKNSIWHKGKYDGVKNPNYGIKWTKEQKEIARKIQKENHKHLVGNNSPNKRIEVRKKISQSAMGANNNRSKKWKIMGKNGQCYFIHGGICRFLKTIGYTYSKAKSIDPEWKVEEII